MPQKGPGKKPQLRPIGHQNLFNSKLREGSEAPENILHLSRMEKGQYKTQQVLKTQEGEPEAPAELFPQYHLILNRKQRTTQCFKVYSGGTVKGGNKVTAKVGKAWGNEPIAYQGKYTILSSLSKPLPAKEEGMAIQLYKQGVKGRGEKNDNSKRNKERAQSER